MSTHKPQARVDAMMGAQASEPLGTNTGRQTTGLVVPTNVLQHDLDQLFAAASKI